MSKLLELIEKGREGGNIGLSIGLPKLENYMDAYLPGTSYMIFARSGTGKSTFMKYAFIYKPLMTYLKTEDKAQKARDPYWIFFNLEESKEQIEARLLSMFIYDNFGEQIRYKEMFSRGRDCMLTDEHYELIKQPICLEFIELLESRISYYPGTFNSTRFESIMKEELKRFGTFSGDSYIPNNPDQIVGVIIDHMSLTRAGAGRTKKEEMDLVSSQSVQFRNKCSIVSPIMVMQNNRDAGNAERLKQGLQEPTESDVKDTGSVYEDSQVVIALHSPHKCKLSTYRGYDIKAMEQKFISAILLNFLSPYIQLQREYVIFFKSIFS